MDTFHISKTQAPLPEEVFSKLCNIALEKCHDKEERRKAGCGGQAMRKRVLIKNFVADLLRAQNERRRLGSISPISSDEDEWEEEDEEEVEEEDDVDQDTQVDEDIDVDEDDEDEPETIPLPPLAPPQSRTFVDSDPSLSSLFPDYLDSTTDCISVNPGHLETKMSSEERLWVYDMYGSESENAYAPHGETTWPSSEGWTITYEGVDDTSNTPYEQQLYVDPGQLCYSDELLYSQTGGGRPADGHDQIFLSLAPGHLAEMKNYSVELPEDVTAGPTYSMEEVSEEPSGTKRPGSPDIDADRPAKRVKI